MLGVSGIRLSANHRAPPQLYNRWNAFTLPIRILAIILQQPPGGRDRVPHRRIPTENAATLPLSLVTGAKTNRYLALFIRSQESVYLELVPASWLLELDRYLRHLGLMLPDLQTLHKEVFRLSNSTRQQLLLPPLQIIVRFRVCSNSTRQQTVLLSTQIIVRFRLFWTNQQKHCYIPFRFVL